MAIYFLDSSALVKRYISENGSNWIYNLFEPSLGNQFFIAAITSVEIISAITRRAKSGSINIADAIAIRNQFKKDFQAEYQVIEISEKIINSAINMAELYTLRGYDAVQLASGCELNILCITNGLLGVNFVSADNDLNKAALDEGLVIENPNNYP
ncbi:type II toxin-antitoxin system VapC family toxin [Tumidithrix elongata RA019]|uniref:Type II toxin-antitoxin system VapC family toxin n=1 Tax=Tumidithrix elongata BACA0141 TaxID=2716417 RepID=A0AAW9Q2P6_9CYAN|nr:type II toxin-antitoxin system VapC family toxin [Tumidithrix elongata RA019]